MAVIGHRFINEYIPMLDQKTNTKLKSLNRSKLIKELKSFVELYSTYQPEYDYYDYRNSHTFALFIVR
jgi:hypothetical protein